MKEPRVARRLTDRILEHVAADVRSWLDMGIPFQHAGINVTDGGFSRRGAGGSDHGGIWEDRRAAEACRA